MAEEPVNKWWAVGAKEESTARKYISFLHKHSMFGGHVGLPENIRNKDPNRSLDSSRGVYDMVEVYSVSGTSCPTGTVVNFELNNTVNPLGVTYVYPCNDTSKPMGYMITKAAPNIWGVCVVSGILEVPLIYLRGTSASELERKDYVEYDLESAAFKFSDSGYPVYNVYQDVDGDWIAIILFGNISEEDVYDGPFATSIADISGSAVYVDVAEGDVIYQGIHSVCDGVEYDPEDLSSQIYLTSGEDLWLSIIASGETFEFEFEKSTTGFVDTGTVFYKKIASCTEDFKIKQIQYGNIQYNGVGYPDYYALMGNGEALVDAPVATPEGSSNLLQAINGGLRSLGASGSGSGVVGFGVGVTYVIPVPGNVPIQVIADNPSCIDAIIFSPNYNTADSHKYKYLQASTAWTTPVCGGWVRISVLDNITNGACLRFYCGDEDWTEALPLFRHSYYSGGGGGSDEWLGYPDYQALMGNGTSTNTEASYTVSFSPASNGHIYVNYVEEGQQPGPSYETQTDSNGREYVVINGTTYYVYGDGGQGTTLTTSSYSGSGYEDLGIGMGVSFLLPVSGGSVIQVTSDAPECVYWICYAPFLNSENRGSYHRLTLGQNYTVPEGGWVFISLLDNCAYPNSTYPYGACVRFYVNEVDYTKTLPLFRHGSSTRTIIQGEDYNGPFVALKGATTSDPSASTPEFDVYIYDGCSRNTNNTNYAGYLIAGASRTPVNGGTVSCSPGDYIYLVGSTDGYSYLASSSTYANDPSAFSSYSFATLIARVTSTQFGEKVIQVQHGDIVAPPMRLSSTITSAGNAYISLTGSTSGILLKSANSNLTFSKEASTGAIVLTVSNGSSGGEFGYPNYGTLGAYETTIPDCQGITFLLPVKSRHSVTYYTDASCTVIGRYAPNSGASGDAFYLTKGSGQTVDADGWVRISVFDDGSCPGACLKFVDNSAQFPIYKFGSGGSGGGGGVNAPNWGMNNHIQIINSGSSYTTPSAGWIYACATALDGSAHLVINGAQFKVAHNCGSGICIPVRAGASVSWNVSNATEAWAAFYGNGGGGYY